MRGLARDLVVYVVMHSIAILSLASMGESRIDAYVSMSILVYFVSTSVLPSIREHADLKVMDIILIIIFGLIVVYRVLNILGVSIPGAGA